MVNTDRAGEEKLGTIKKEWMSSHTESCSEYLAASCVATILPTSIPLVNSPVKSPTCMIISTL